MAGQNDTGFVTFTASAAISRGSLVTLANTGKVSASGVGDNPIGSAMEDAFADGDEIAVKLINAPGTHKLIAAGDFTIDTILYGAASGKVDNTAGVGTNGKPVGLAMTAAAADGDLVEVILSIADLA